MSKKPQPAPKNFEEALRELEQILSEIEGGEVGLEESLVKYERGNFLIQHCRGILSGAERQIEILSKQADGELKYALSNLPADTTCLRAVRLWKSRWAVEQGYQQLKEELGLDHFEGRSWRGFHHHAALVILAFGFLLLERHRGQGHPVQPGKKGVDSRG